MKRTKEEVFPRKALFKYLGKDLFEIGSEIQVSEEHILEACKKHLREKGFLPSEWEEYVLSKINE